ncbi:MAG: crossover junction endodeoxyribonuclease RuvC [Gemmatales bacterium]|nr:crossover junction endodeoxyribonuclease RuvC [Gemmatales bacterium]MDW7993262.1 crossover junction endodeoxyribonuclease RuvC [Gemmatales bacterium]
MRIIGIDPGLQVTGYGVITFSHGKWRLIEAGVVRPLGQDLPSRLRKLWDGVQELLQEQSPDVLAIEELYSHYAHPRTALLMAHARGVILTAAARYAVPIVTYPATRIKKTITGSGHATKEQIQRVIQDELGLPSRPEPADVADALACALCHAFVHQGRTVHKTF